MRIHRPILTDIIKKNNLFLRLFFSYLVLGFLAFEFIRTGIGLYNGKVICLNRFILVHIEYAIYYSIFLILVGIWIITLMILGFKKSYL